MIYCYSDFFADDATLHTHDNKPDKVEEKLQSGADNAKDWIRQNNMHINNDESNYMIYAEQIIRTCIKSLILE